MFERDEMSVGMIATIGAVSVLLTIATVLGVLALYWNQMGVEQERKVVQAPVVSSESRIAEQEAKLARYGWKDKSKGIVVIPIEEAMQLVVSDLNAAPVSAGTEVKEESK